MNSKLVAIIIAVLSFSLHGIAWSSNLLSNQGFESFPSNLHLTSGVSVIGDWRCFFANGANGSIDATSDAHSGSIALKLTRNNTAGDSGIDRYNSQVAVTAGRLYQCGVWAKTPTSGNLLITIAYHDAGGVWMGSQISNTFFLTNSYKSFSYGFVPPPGCAYVNYSLRVNGTGVVIVDDTSIIDAVANTPTITYPDVETVDSFKPSIAFAGVPHTAYQVIVSFGSTTAWDSGIVASTGFSCQVGVSLQPLKSYTVKVRLQTTSGWTSYCTAIRFATPAAPIVKLTAPCEADSVIDGPGVTAGWRVDSPGAVISQSIRIDNGTPVQLAPTDCSYNMVGLSKGVHTVSITATTPEGTASDTCRFNVHVTPTANGELNCYDLSYVLSYSQSDPRQLRLSYDIPMAVAALQGLVNRGGPKLFLKMTSRDDTWLERLRSPGNWLYGMNVVNLPTGVTNLASLFSKFSSYYNGAVVWDPNVYSTANVATTVAGADNLIPIRYDTTPGSVYSILVTSGLIPVKVDLTNKFTGTGMIWDTNIPSTDSKKCDAYVWARNKYIETGKCDPSLYFFGIDAYWLINREGGSIGNYLLNRDYIVRNKGFAYDLCMWGDETPVDDPLQPLGTDLNTMKSILAAGAARSPGMLEVVGFTPWPVKYSNWNQAGGTHEPVASEWTQMSIQTSYNAYGDCDALFYNFELANASIYCQFPLPERYAQNRKYSQTELRKKGYVNKSNVVSNLNYLNFYIGDYDSTSWISGFGMTAWDDTGRGSLPMSWAFNPNLTKRGAPLFDYYYRTRTSSDFFVAGDSGAGYVNPTMLLGNRPSGLPSARDIWIKHNLNYFRQMNVKLSGFIINGFDGVITPEVDDMYAAFSVNGTFSQPLWYPQGDHISGSMPCLTQQSDLNQTDVATAVNQIRNFGILMSPRFLNFRSIVVPPSWLKSVYDGVVAADTSMPWTILDSETYAALAKCNMGVVPDARATYCFDTVPSTLHTATPFVASIGIRNDGWVTWSATGTSAVTLLLKWMQGTQVVSTASVVLPKDIASGDGVVLDVTITPPSSPGTYTLRYEMAKGGVGFSSLGDYAWEATKTVLAPPISVDISGAKQNAAGVYLSFGAVFVARFENQYYFEDSDRSSGIRVDSATAGLSDADINKHYAITGYSRVDSSNQERYLDAQLIVPTGSTLAIGPLGLTNWSVGGGDFGNPEGGLGQIGVISGTGLNNIGMLVKTTGLASGGNADGFSLEDGSGAPVSVALPGAGSAYDNHYVVVTGISSIAGNGSRLLKVRKSADVQIVN